MLWVQSDHENHPIPTLPWEGPSSPVDCEFWGEVLGFAQFLSWCRDHSCCRWNLPGAPEFWKRCRKSSPSEDGAGSVPGSVTGRQSCELQPQPCRLCVLTLCALCWQDFERSRAFTFLNEIKKRFQTTYGSRAQTALPYAMNSEFSSVLAAQLKYHSESKGPDQVAETQAQIDELKGIMVRNIDLVAQRGEKLELLIDKTENLVDSSVTFKTTSRNLARAMCMKNLKLTIVIIIVSIVILYIILSAVCGGLAWPSCVQK
uniref:AP-3 complex subunit delta-1 n=1 Tax=Taeniopygia guttata TaxID=59729 RepID=A0A674GP01_TAEGU